MNLEKSESLSSQPPPLPVAPLLDTSTSAQFYVVSKKKFFALFLSTLGVYSAYWFWKQWSVIKKSTGEKMWPIARTLFTIFFAYPLFEQIESAANEVLGIKRTRLRLFALIYIGAIIGFRIIDRISVLAIVYLSALMFLTGLLSFCAWQAQEQANIASKDDKGLNNSCFTALNYFWMILGVIVWSLIILGTLISPFEEF